MDNKSGGTAGPSTNEHASASVEPARRVVPVGERLLAKNDRLATENRRSFEEKGLLVLNVVSAPGSGKTALLERTLADLGGRLRIGVIVGDLATDNDSRRLRRSGAAVVQITTGTVCHLDAAMVARACTQLDLDCLDVLVIENVGNLVCPASYDLGEALRVVLLGVTEGEDKPLKYPILFRTAQVVVVSKTDLIAAVGFDRETAHGNIRRVAPGAEVIEVSARTGQGLDSWYDYLQRQVCHARR
jgi:hydrogenase nickel incorporation protein HypB